MKKINNEEQKMILISILKYIDEICNQNKINYSLIGGSLIGAVREKNIIPWDDDVDIILLEEDYKKLREILIKENKYLFLDHGVEKSYYYPFGKLIDTSTEVYEHNQKRIKNYGVFIDIFTYNYLPKNKLVQKIYMKKLYFIKQFITGFASSTNKKKFLKGIRNFIANLIGIDLILKLYDKHCKKYNKNEEKCEYIVSNWPIYGIDKEVQKKNNFSSFEKTKFSDINVSITSSYNEILTKTFGDYMKRPSKEKQISNHSFDAYRKDR